MVKHTQTICRLLPTNCLSVFKISARLARKGLTSPWACIECLHLCLHCKFVVIFSFDTMKYNSNCTFIFKGLALQKIQQIERYSPTSPSSFLHFLLTWKKQNIVIIYVGKYKFDNIKILNISYFTENFFLQLLHNLTITANIYLFKVNNKDTRKRYQICSKLIIKTLQRRQ